MAGADSTAGTDSNLAHAATGCPKRLNNASGDFFNRLNPFVTWKSSYEQ